MVNKNRPYFTLFILLLMMVGCKDETKVESVRLEPEEITLAVGETRQLELVINPVSSAIYNSKVWGSSDQNVAVVDSKGNVTAVYAGTCTITVKVGDQRAKCKVTVKTPEYDLQMAHGAVYNTGVDSETGVMTQVLRLYDEGLTMDGEGNVTGNGLMISLAMCSPMGTDTLTVGRYVVEESHREMTLKPGEYREEGGRSYVTGSFLGQYTDNGLSVLLLTAGEVEIKRAGDGYSVECQMEGLQKELVTVRWEGKPARYKSDSLPEPERISYNKMEMRDTIVENEETTKHTIVVLGDGKTEVRLLFRLPLTATQALLAGRYTLSLEEESYTISAEGSEIERKGQKIDLQSANIAVKQSGGVYVIEGNVSGVDGNEYVIERRE